MTEQIELELRLFEESTALANECFEISRMYKEDIPNAKRNEKQGVINDRHKIANRIKGRLRISKSKVDTPVPGCD